MRVRLHDPGRPHFEHVVDSEIGAVAHELIQLLAVAHAAVVAKHNRRERTALAYRTMTERLSMPVATAVTSSGSSARNQLHTSVKCVISKSMGPCGACALSNTQPFQLYQSSLMRTETEGTPSSGSDGKALAFTPPAPGSTVEGCVHVLTEDALRVHHGRAGAAVVTNAERNMPAA